jgi:PilZ domain
MDQASSVPLAAGESGDRPDRAQRRPVEFPAHLLLAGGAMLDVRVLDLSYDGCRIDVSRLLSQGEAVQLSVEGRGVIDATVRWYKDGRAGLQFADDAEARDQVARKDKRRTAGMEAQLRRIGRLKYWVELRDLSPEGCMIDLVERPAMDEVMQIRLPGLETLQARVRWIDNYVAGLKFERPIHPAVFELLLQRMGR